MKINKIILILLLSACTTNKTIKFQLGRSKTVFKIDIPKGYEFEGIKGGSDYENRFWYSDSSVIYITTFSNTLNYKKIIDQGTYYNGLFEAVHYHDTLTLMGCDSTGLFWKNKRLQYISIGYSNVPLSRKKEFEEALSSIKN